MSNSRDCARTRPRTNDAMASTPEGEKTLTKRLLLVVLLYMGIFLTIIIGGSMVVTYNPRGKAPGGTCMLDGKAYPQGAIARTGSRPMRCDGGAWTGIGSSK
jgi:hypothetical protein